MTSTTMRRKRTNNDMQDEQALYENAIRDDDMKKFLKLYESDNIAAASVMALRWASQAKTNAYLEKIKMKLQPNDLRQLITICQTFGVTVEETVAEKRVVGDNDAKEDGDDNVATVATTSSKKKAKTLSTSSGAVTSQTLAETPIDKLVKQWPFQVARVAWNDNYKTRQSTEKPLEIQESQAKWQELVQIATAFISLAAHKPAAGVASTAPNQVSLQEQLFERLEATARAEKGVQRGADVSLEAKFINCRQTARMVFSRIVFIEQMNFVVLRRDAAAADKGAKYDFFQLLKKEAVPIPPASSFKGKAANFASQFQQHLNATVFDQKDSFVSSIEYVNNSSISAL